jgi:hypothetical protein
VEYWCDDVLENGPLEMSKRDPAMVQLAPLALGWFVQKILMGGVFDADKGQFNPMHYGLMQRNLGQRLLLQTIWATPA